MNGISEWDMMGTVASVRREGKQMRNGKAEEGRINRHGRLSGPTGKCSPPTVE